MQSDFLHEDAGAASYQAEEDLLKAIVSVP